MKKTMSLVLGIALLAAGVWADDVIKPTAQAAAAAADAAKGEAPSISVEPTTFDFGKALQNKQLEKEFTIHNFGAQELVIDNVSTSCGCTVAEGYSKTVKPGDSTTMRVSFKTGANRGPVLKSILISSNDPVHAKLEVKIMADISPAPAPAPAK